MKVSQFINNLNDIDPEYILVPEGVDLSEVAVLRVERSSSSGYTYPDGIYFDRSLDRFEELTTVN